MLNGTNIFSEMKDVVIELIVRLNQSPAEDELGTYEAKRIGLAYSFSMTDEEIEEMISEAKEEGTYEEMKEEILRGQNICKRFLFVKPNNKKRTRSLILQV